MAVLIVFYIVSTVFLVAALIAVGTGLSDRLNRLQSRYDELWEKYYQIERGFYELDMYQTPTQPSRWKKRETK